MSYKFPPRPDGLQAAIENLSTKLGEKYSKGIPAHRQVQLDILNTTVAKAKGESRMKQSVWLVGALLFIKQQVSNTYYFSNPSKSALYSEINGIEELQGIDKGCSKFTLARFKEFYESQAFTMNRNGELQRHMGNPYAAIADPSTSDSKLDVKAFEKQLKTVVGDTEPFSIEKQKSLRDWRVARDTVERASNPDIDAQLETAPTQPSSSYFGSVFSFFTASSQPKSEVTITPVEPIKAEDNSPEVNNSPLATPPSSPNL